MPWPGPLRPRVAEHGPIGVVVANAGAADSVPFAKMTPAQLKAMLAVNLIGVWPNVWQAALPDMKSAGWGRMIAIASTAGLKGFPYVAAYCAAKHGVVGLTRALSLELASTGITVNAICPGFHRDADAGTLGREHCRKNRHGRGQGPCVTGVQEIRKSASSRPMRWREPRCGCAPMRRDRSTGRR